MANLVFFTVNIFKHLEMIIKLLGVVYFATCGHPVYSGIDSVSATATGSDITNTQQPNKSHEVEERDSFSVDFKAPFFKETLDPLHRTITAKVGNKAQLDCASDGNPPPKVRWFKFDVPLQNITYRDLGETSTSHLWNLELNNLLLADSGNYSCHVNNTLGSISQEFILLVYESSRSRPMISKSLLTNQTAVIGSDVSFSCHVTSKSSAYVRWYVEKRLVQSNASKNSTRAPITEVKSILPIKVATLLDSQSHNLYYRGEVLFRVRNVTFDDEGRYACEVFNEQGKSQHGAFLSVVPGPTPSERELEARYAALFGEPHEFPLAVLVALPVGVLIVLAAVFIRALERVKHGQSVKLVKQVVINGEAVIMRDVHSNNSNKESPNQESKNQCKPSAKPHENANHINNGVQNGQRGHTPLPTQASRETFRWSTQASDVGSKRCSAVIDLEWEGLELDLQEGFEMVKLCKEEDV